MHEKDWIHLGKPSLHRDIELIDSVLDVKPDNIFINWDFDSNRQFRLQKILLGDMDCDLKLNSKIS